MRSVGYQDMDQFALAPNRFWLSGERPMLWHITRKSAAHYLNYEVCLVQHPV